MARENTSFAPRGFAGHQNRFSVIYSLLSYPRPTQGSRTVAIRKADASQSPDSANSQFFINFKDNHFLNGQYTVYGRVIDGMEHVDAIVRGEPPMSPDRMISVKVAADV